MKRMILTTLLAASTLLSGCASVQQASDSLCCYSRYRAEQKSASATQAQNMRAAEVEATYREQMNRQAALMPVQAGVRVYSCDRDEISQAQCALSDLGIETIITR